MQCGFFFCIIMYNNFFLTLSIHKLSIISTYICQKVSNYVTKNQKFNEFRPICTFFCADCRISEKIINVQYLIRACRLEKILKINKRACMAIRQLRVDRNVGSLRGSTEFRNLGKFGQKPILCAIFVAKPPISGLSNIQKS